MRVRLTHNLAPEMGLSNGGTGTVVGFVFPAAVKDTLDPAASAADVAAGGANPPLPALLVQFDKSFFPHAASALPTMERVVPVMPTKTTINCGGREYDRVQLPLCAATCTTVHACQGMTCQQHVMMPAANRPNQKQRQFTRSLLYVQLSRVTCLLGLFLLLALQAKDFTNYSPLLVPIAAEYARLRRLRDGRRQRLLRQQQQQAAGGGPAPDGPRLGSGTNMEQPAPATAAVLASGSYPARPPPAPPPPPPPPPPAPAPSAPADDEQAS